MVSRRGSFLSLMSIFGMSIFGGLILGSAAPAAFAQGNPTDDRIYDEVRRILANDVDVKGAGFDVDVRGGVVTLKGRVHTEKGRTKATTLTKKVKGVVSVDNQLKLFGVDD
jgi:osmotically-inducible protein OsmY